MLTSKPLEYGIQSDGLNDGTERTHLRGHYYDITPVLDRLSPIKRFRQAAGVSRRS